MKTGRLLFGIGAIAALSAVLIALTWFITLRSVHTEQAESLSQTQATLSGEALAARTQIERQIVAIDQMLSQMTAAWQSSPATFDVSAWRRQALTVDDVARDVFVADDTGTIRQATLPDAIGQGVGNQDFFIVLSARPRSDSRLFLGAPTITPLLRQWHINAARALRHPDGTFAGTINTDYRIDAITAVLGQPALGSNGMALVVSLKDGKLRGMVGGAPTDPDVSIADTPLFAALQAADSGVWTGRSPTDAVTRILAFSRIPDRDLAVAVGMDEQQALAQALAWRKQAIIYATIVTLLILATAWLLARRVRLAAHTARATRELSEALAFAKAQADVLRAAEERKSGQLDATLAGAGEGIAIIDSHLCLAEWNDRFCDLAGVPASQLRAGMPMEEVVRGQIAAGSFGPVDDPDAELAQQIARLRAHTAVSVRRQHPDGRTLEIHRRPLPEGGFVLYYSDITEQSRSEERLRRVHAVTEAAAAAHMRFASAVVTELRARTEELAAAVNGLAATNTAEDPSAPSIGTPAGGDGAGPHTPHGAAMTEVPRGTAMTEVPRGAAMTEVPRGAAATAALRDLAATVDDIEEMAHLATAHIAPQPRLFDLRAFLDDVAKSLRTSGAETGAAFQWHVSSTLPPTVYADAAWLNRLISALAGFALSVTDPGSVTMDVGRGHNAAEGVIFYFRLHASRFPADTMASMLADQPLPDNRGRTHMFRLALCRRIAGVLGATLGYDPPSYPGDEHGISLVLPPRVLPIRPVVDDRLTEAAAAEPALVSRAHRLPRTRILLVEDIPANQIVTATLLRREGHLVDIASSGDEAIALVRRVPYDLIFMDVLMPGMDGPAASEAIRALPAPACEVPIIALTADEPDDPAIDPGMAVFDAILGKPVVLTDLLTTLENRVWYRFPHAEQARESLSTQDDAQAVSQVLSAERLLELRGNLSAETFVSLIEECLTDLEAQVPALRQAVASGQPGPVVAHAHAMVGMAAGYGMAELENTLRIILNAARAGDLAVLDQDIMARVDASLAATAKALREMMQDVVS
ncbi:MAG TPA: PAS-domain containing protein [Rhodopila sp.]|nr:PAS-domain containing protein [Rhodopila sp.]